MKRLFIAIKIPADENLLASLNKLRSKLHSFPIKWVDPENLHLTLLFLGDTTLEETEIIRQKLTMIAQNAEEFHLLIKKFGFFESKDNFPKVIWFGIQDESEGKLKLLYKSINSKIISGDKKPHFSPHLTLGRVKYPIKIPLLLQLRTDHENVCFQKLKVNSFGLYESKLTPSGPVYSIIEEFSLNEI
jgi:RNA 2',3'-cyclic 3'-phosphodiesterase